MSVPINPNTAVVFPDGQQFYVANISSLQASAANVLVGIGGAVNVYTFAATDAATAQAIVSQINQAKIGLLTGLVILSNGMALTWASMSPDTGAANTDLAPITITGTDFSMFGATVGLQLDDGAGNGAVGQGAVQSDVSISYFTGGGVPALPASTYELYYTTDNFATRKDTGLNLTIS